MREDFKILIEYVLILWRGSNIDDEEFEDLIKRNGFEIDGCCSIIDLAREAEKHTANKQDELWTSNVEEKDERGNF